MTIDLNFYFVEMAEYKLIYQRRTVFLLSHASIFLMGTEGNCTQRQIYNSFIHHLNWNCFVNAKWLPDIILSQRAPSQMIRGPEIRLWFVFFFLWERSKINQVDRVKKKSTTTRCEICPKLTVNDADLFIKSVLCSFSILTLNRWMPVGTCWIYTEAVTQRTPRTEKLPVTERLF